MLLRRTAPSAGAGQAPDDAAVVRQARAVGRARTVSVSIALAVATVCGFCVSVVVGDYPVPLLDVIPAVVGLSDDASTFVVQNLRLPRALVALLAGAAFGLSGAIIQALARNPLASPDIIGITAGASAVAVFTIVVLGSGSTTVSAGALVGSLLAALAIYLLAYKRGVSTYRLVLIGIGIGALLEAFTAYLIVRAEFFELVRASFWLAGSLNGRDWDDVRNLTVACCVLIPTALILTRSLGALQLGDDAARGLGLRVEREKAAVILVAVALAGFATAAAGPVAFVAFVSPAIARRLVRHPVALVPSALAGGLLVLVADVVGRRLFAPTELPVGVVTALIGGPYLLWLLYHANREGATG